MSRCQVPRTVSPTRSRAAPFVDAAAVEAWDAWFRWREHGTLHDLTIDDTWARTARALAASEAGAGAEGWERRFTDALSGWHLLPDERVLAAAGTGKLSWPADGLAATLNLASFVRARFTGAAQFDRALFEETTALALRAIDNAAMLAGRALEARGTAEMGVIGLADALAMLGLPYGCEQAVEFARGLAQTLAESCLRASTRLAAERGGAGALDQGAVALAERLGLTRELRAELEQHGLRFKRHTRICPRPRLAQLANNVSDALDPLPCQSKLRIETPPGGRPLGASEPAAALSPGVDAGLAQALQPVDVAAQVAMRAAFQRYMDAPIDYPICA